MKALLPNSSSEPLHLLLVGNNPTEIGFVLEKVKQVRKRKIITEIAFDFKTIAERLATFRPNYILIDDNIGREELSQTVTKLLASKKTKDIPIAVIKNSNYSEALGSKSIVDYLLKQNLSAETLYNTIRNTLRFRRTQRYLFDAYQKRKGILNKVIRGNVLNLINQ